MSLQNLAFTRTLEDGTENVTTVPVAATLPTIVDISRAFMFYSLTICIPFGLLFNTISVFVFMSRKLRRRSASWYLAALATSDDISLLTIMFDYWLKDPRIGFALTKRSDAWCGVITYLSYWSRLYSALLVMSFTIERFVGVVFPLRRPTLRNPTHVKLILVLEALLCLLGTSFTWFTIEVVHYSGGMGMECDVRPDRYKIYMAFCIVVLIFGSIVLPIIVICTLNTFMFRRIWLRKTFAHKNMTFSGNKPINRRRSNYNTATLILVVSTTFVILNFPYCVAWLLLFFDGLKLHPFHGDAYYHLYAAKLFTAAPYFLNFSINFLVYNICAEAFRVELLRFCCFLYRIYRLKVRPLKRQSSRRQASHATSSERDCSSRSVERYLMKDFCPSVRNVNLKTFTIACSTGPVSSDVMSHFEK